MSEVDYRELFIKLFVRLRPRLKLGVDELRDALRLLDGEWQFGDEDEVRRDLRLLWGCRAPFDDNSFDDAWRDVLTQAAQAETAGPLDREEDLSPESAGETAPDTYREFDDLPAQSSSPATTMLPVAMPPAPRITEEPSELNTSWPLPWRSMAYGWRYLRRPVADGPPVILDLNATVERVARQGFYLSPIYRRQVSNRIRLIVLIDQGGSMVPFHRFTNDLVESARQSGHFTEEQLEVYYFHNVIGDEVYSNPHLTRPVPFENIVDSCDGETSILIVSDAGAARGFHRLDRIRSTTDFLFQLRNRTNLIAWLNPMPEDRWLGTSAQVINFLVRMSQMNADGFSQAIDVAQGITHSGSG